MGVPAAEISQVCLEVAAHPTRIRAQAEAIRQCVLGALFDEKWRCPRRADISGFTQRSR